MKYFSKIFLIVAMGCIPASTLLARQDDISDFKKSMKVALPPVEGDEEPQLKMLLLNGTGLCEWGFFSVDLYWAALYLEEKSSKPEEIIASKEAKCVHLRFVRALTRAQLQEAYTASFEANAEKSLPRYQKRLARLNAMMDDVDEGDSLIFTYLPGKGTEVRLKGKVKGRIKGDDFGSMLFRLYLGQHPPSFDLKEGLLGTMKG